MIYHVLWQTVMVVHFLVLAYIALGGYLAWKWPRLIWPSVAFAGWGAIQLTGLVECPLTALENWARERAGAHLLEPGGFIDTYLTGVVYPPRHLAEVRAGMVVVIAVSWIGFAVIRHRRQVAGKSQTSTA
ncbi:DUF2784 domain-containing protein [Herbidospora sp. NBRC 101105]|uniref:DUF2784 domain-containing protein n=1 Tax=Herbidospora sp. NBRC 101105 TaxID=3032195 RepID=UPI0024A2B9D9|nr:DUF2784 domain-containing protein [Herbidospora sp. NBRC 101105]GLX92815.1 hypothetical protein Hesp01_07650 [Herbidospora sp. NBRC 101105]